MTLKKKIFFLSFLICLFLPLSWAAPDLQRSHACSERELSNQLKVILIPTISDTASVLLTVKTGSLSEGKYLGKGVSHFLEHLVFMGTEDNNETELARKVQALGGYVNARTSPTETQYYIHLPSKNIEKALSIIAEMVLQCDFEEKDFEKEKNVILHEMDMNEDNPMRRLSLAFFQEHYFNTLASVPVIGFRSAFKTLTLQDVQDYYRSTYQPSNMILTVCGRFEEESLFPKIEQIYGRKASSSLIMNSFSSIQRPVGKRMRSLPHPQLQREKVMMGFRSCSLSNPELYPLDIAAEILAGGESSRLMQKLLYTNLVSSVSCSNYTPQYEGVFIITFDLAEGTLDSVKDIIFRELQELKNGSVDQREITRAIRRMSLDQATSLEKNSEKAFRYTESYLMTGTFDFPTVYLDKIKTVTPEDIASAARKIFYDDSLTLLSLVPESKAKISGEAKSSRSKIPVEKPSLTTLANGVRVILNRDTEALATTIDLYMKGGAAYSADSQRGISYLISQLLTKGTQNLTQKQFAEKLELMGGQASPISGYNAMGLRLTVLNESLEEALSLLLDILQSASFSQEEFEVARKQALEVIKKQNEDIFSYGMLVMRGKMFPGHPYGASSYGTAESVSTLSREQCLSFFHRALAPKNLVLSLAGGFEAKKTLDFIHEHFSALQPPEGEPLPEPTTFHEAPLPGYHEVSFPSHQVLVLSGFSVPNYLSPERYTFEFLDTFFSDQSSPLFETIRSQEGLAYTTGSVYMKGPYGGFFLFYCLTSPENKEKVRAMLLSNIESFHKKGISRKDFSSVFERFMAEHVFSIETSGARSEASAFDELYGLGYDLYLKFSDEAAKMTREKVNAALRDFFGPGKAVTVCLAPGEAAAP